MFLGMRDIWCSTLPGGRPGVEVCTCPYKVLSLHSQTGSSNLLHHRPAVSLSVSQVSQRARLRPRPDAWQSGWGRQVHPSRWCYWWDQQDLSEEFQEWTGILRHALTLNVITSRIFTLVIVGCLRKTKQNRKLQFVKSAEFLTCQMYNKDKNKDLYQTRL